MGCEKSNYHGPYRYFTADVADLDYYFIAGPQIADVSRRFTWMTGRPMFFPRWSLGYSGSTMSYTDHPHARERMRDFLAKCKSEQILCQSFHLSSGYTSAGDKRYVFHWNTQKFPDPTEFFQSYLSAGVRVIPNVKPCLALDHPLFAECERRGLFLSESVQFWSFIGRFSSSFDAISQDRR